MIRIEDLRLAPKGRGSVAREELRRAAQHLDTVVVRSARILCEIGAVGYDLSVVEAFALLRKREINLPLVEMANDTLRAISGLRSPSAERVTQLLEDVVLISNELDHLVDEYRRAQSAGLRLP